jgi:hypothetical protein
MELSIDEIVDFAIKNGEGGYSNINRELMTKAVELHKKYGTFMEVYDEKGLAAIARWDWVNKETTHIMDVVIRKNARSLKSLKGLLMLGIKHNPNCKYIGYQRQAKYGDEVKVFSVKEFIGG